MANFCKFRKFAEAKGKENLRIRTKATWHSNQEMFFGDFGPVAPHHQGKEPREADPKQVFVANIGTFDGEKWETVESSGRIATDLYDHVLVMFSAMISHHDALHSCKLPCACETS